MEFLSLFFLLCIFMLLFCYTYRNKNGMPTNWPFIGMLFTVLANTHRIHDFLIELLEKSNLTFHFLGPWCTNMEIIITSDPKNIHHIMSKSFTNYPKGERFNDIFDVLGDGIFNSDGELWKYHRKMAQTFLGHPKFNQFLLKRVSDKVNNGLIPVLNYASKHGLVIDLQDLFERFAFDNICALTMGYELGSLCVEFPRVPFSKALDDVEEVIFYRHVLPFSVWKFMRWLSVGQENKLKKAWEILDNFIYNCIAKKFEELKQVESNSRPIENEECVDVLTLCKVKDEKFLRDIVLNFFIAGRDTTSTALSWFFYLLSQNPKVLSKIRQELDTALKSNEYDGLDENKMGIFTRKNIKESASDNLVYLHAALCEALRLYPPVVFQSKNPIEEDVLPSGHLVKPHVQIVFNIFGMARMKSVWGEDCCEFKPERWISPLGKIKHEPSYKFLAFNAGPRTCVGKEMAFIQMKIMAATMIRNYEFHAVEGQSVVPNTSIILKMKNGFKVKVSKLQS